jgi:predicted unusual protein kinase regulating ubiquinone biosynthesis (AarF/ABC1/UbiB family)
MSIAAKDLSQKKNEDCTLSPLLSPRPGAWKPQQAPMIWWLVAISLAVFTALLLFPLPQRALITAAVALRRFVPRLLVRLRLRSGYSRARAIRLSFEDLGPAYIKFGQMIASSPTAFPKHVTAEFSKCLDEVRPIPRRAVWRILRDELGRDPKEVFAEIDPQPLASASIAQVHAARLKNGDYVVIKVQRPGIERRVARDLGLMGILARWAERRHSDLARANLSGIVADFRRTIAEEMDFLREADNIEQFRELLQSEQLSHLAIAPRVYRELSSRRLLVMERLFGVRIDDKEGVSARVQTPGQLLRHTSHVFWTCVFLGGFFHGDIHAGNIMVLDDGRLGYIDFGIFGRFSMNDRIAMAEWLAANVTGDGQKLAASMKRMGAVPETADWDAFVRDVTEVFLPMRTLTVDQPEKLGQFFPRLREVANRHDLRLPQNFVLILKQVTYFGRYVMIHDPSFNENLDPQTQKFFFHLFAKFHNLRQASGHSERTSLQAPS